MTVASTTKVANLNADLLDGLDTSSDTYNASVAKVLKSDADGGGRVDHWEVGNVTGAVEGQVKAAADGYFYGVNAGQASGAGADGEGTIKGSNWVHARTESDAGGGHGTVIQATDYTYKRIIATAWGAGPGDYVDFYAPGNDAANNSPLMRLTESEGAVFYANIYVTTNCSALTFTDRTPYPDLATAIAAVRSARRDGTNLDHATLHDSVKSKGGRNLSATVSAQNEVIKMLLDRVEALERGVAPQALEAT
jgi:hypothetical protein